MSRVALLVDHPQRDLDGLLLLAAQLCTKGVTSFLVPSRLARKELPGLAPDVVLLNHIGQFDIALVTMLTDIGSRVAVLDTEGGVLENFDVYRQGLAPTSVCSAIGRFFSWGPKLAQHALKESWFQEKQVVVSGHPRFDYYQMPWRNVILNRILGSSDVLRPMILVVGSFPLANPRFQTVEQEVDLLISKAHQDPEVVQRRHDAESKGLIGLVALAGAIASAIPVARVVYRPHPFERAETYRNILSPQVELGDRGTAIDWIMNAKAVVQRGSTLAVEAKLAGIPVMSPEWLADWSRANWIRSVSIVCQNENEMLDHLKNVVAGGNHPDQNIIEVDKLLHDWFFRLDGCANERVVNGIIDLLREGSIVNLRRARAHFTGFRGCDRSLGGKIASAIRYMAAVPADFSFRRMMRFDIAWPWDDGSRTFTVDEIKKKLDALLTIGFQNKFAVEIAASCVLGDYILPNRLGRSITIVPSNGNSS